MDGHVVAALWKRWLAAVIDGLLLALPSVPRLIRARKGPRRSSGSLDALAILMSGAYQVSTTVVVGQTLGQRALGIRVARRDTGGVPAVSQVLLRWMITAVPDGLSLLKDRYPTPKDEHARAALEDLGAEVKALRQRHGPDQQGLNQALMALYQEREVNPMTACLSMLLDLLPGVLCRCVLYAPALRAPLHQGLHDRLANTIVVASSPPLGRGRRQRSRRMACSSLQAT